MNENMRVRLPRLLKKELNADGKTLKERARLSPDDVQITLNLQPLSTVSMRVPENSPDIVMHDWAEVYNQHGSVGIYRVVSIQPSYGKELNLTLNHAMDVLNDSIYPGELKYSGTVSQFISQMLNAQTQKLGNVAYWQIGTIDDTGAWACDISYDNILDLLKEIPEEHQDFMYTFDFSVFPWKLNLVRKPDTVLTEFRLNRNIESCKPNITDTELCTRLYLSITSYTGTGDTRKSTTTFEVHDDAAAQDDWGVVCKPVGIDTDKVPLSQKSAWIADYFERHHSPTVQISVDGRELNELTGETIDEMHMGYLCRVALPRYNTIFNERIVTIKYPNALKRPTTVSVSMANKRETTEDSIASAHKEAKKASKSGSSAKKKADNNSATINEKDVIYNRTLEATDKKIVSTMTATGVKLDANNNPMVDANGKYVFDDTGAGATLYSRVTATAGALATEVQNRTQQGQTLQSSITQEANKISQIVTAVGADGAVTAASIVAAVNSAGSSVIIQADHINLEGYVTSSTLDTRLMYFDQMIGNTGTAKTIRLTGQTGIVASGAISAGSVSSTGAVSAGSFRLTSSGGNDTVLNLKAVSFGGVTQGNISLMGSGSLNTLAIPDAISALQITSSGDTYTLQKKTFSSDSWTDVGSFNRAASVQISGHWSGRNYIVTATPAQASSPVGIVYDGLVPTGSISKSGKNVSRDFIVYSDDGNGNADSIIMTKTVTISASGVYDDGYLNGRPTSGTAGGRTSGVSGYVHDFTINRAEGNAVVLAIDCSSIYTTARSGYTYGTFVQATVTPQGASDSVFVEMTSGGNDYYTADTAVTLYEAGTQATYYAGDGGTFTVQGASAGTIYKRKTSGSLRLSRYSSSSVELFIYERNQYYSVGNHVWWYQSNSGTYYYLGDGTDNTLYHAGTTTVEARGTEVPVTPIGNPSTITPIDATSKKHLVATTRYKAGTPDSTTYYTKS